MARTGSRALLPILTVAFLVAPASAALADGPTYGVVDPVTEVTQEASNVVEEVGQTAEETAGSAGQAVEEVGQTAVSGDAATGASLPLAWSDPRRAPEGETAALAPRSEAVAAGDERDGSTVVAEAGQQIGNGSGRMEPCGMPSLGCLLSRALRSPGLTTAVVVGALAITGLTVGAALWLMGALGGGGGAAVIVARGDRPRRRGA
ncbi:MAG TPA: hypothetical protein VNO17_06560 [Actinomycetota bacterium]|nr:hypothetical protein [Actinomycetota bacterium]